MSRHMFSNGKWVYLRRFLSLAIGIGCALFTLSVLLPAAAEAAQVTLAWDGSTGPVAGYRLFVRSEGQAYDYSRFRWQGTATSCTVDQLDENGVHYFVVRAFDAQGNESGDSNEVAFNPSSSGDPGSPGPQPGDPSDPSDAVPPEPPVAQDPADQADGVALEPALTTSPFSHSSQDKFHAQTRWQIFRQNDDLCIFDLQSDAYLTQLNLPPLVLDPECTYYWSAQHYTQAGAASSPSNGVTFTTVAWSADEDGNGIPDSQEIVEDTDIDGDGRPDTEQNEMKCLLSTCGAQQFGVQATADSVPVQLQAVQSLDASAIDSPSANQPEFSAGLYNFKILIDQPGESARVRISFAEPLPEQDHFFMFDPSLGFVDYGERGLIAPDGKTAEIQIQDGGEGDMDGVANGIIVGLGGYGTSSTAAETPSGDGGGGGGGGCFINSLF